MYKHFDISEFNCPCCSIHQEGIMSTLLVQMLDVARHVYGRPIIINSGYRCAGHNVAVGGSPTSSHRNGVAADISCTVPGNRFELLKCLYDVGFERIGIREDFIHVDIDILKPRRRLWTY